MKKTNYEESIFCDALNDNIKGFIPNEISTILKEYSTKEKILKGMEYRPDKVAAYYLGNPNYSWIIDLANNFTEGIKEYRLGRTILIPNLNDVRPLLSKYI